MTPRHSEPIDLLVIGYGNTLRSDDGVGPRVAEAIAALDLPGVQALSCSLLTPELAEQISKSHRVVFVDAALAHEGMTFRSLAPAQSSQIMAHAADPRVVLALARDVFGHAPPGWWLTIPANDIGIGDELSREAQIDMARAVEEIKKLAAQKSEN